MKTLLTVYCSTTTLQRDLTTSSELWSNPEYPNGSSCLNFQNHAFFFQFNRKNFQSSFASFKNTSTTHTGFYKFTAASLYNSKPLCIVLPWNDFKVSLVRNPHQDIYYAGRGFHSLTFKVFFCEGIFFRFSNSYERKSKYGID